MLRILPQPRFACHGTGIPRGLGPPKQSSIPHRPGHSDVCPDPRNPSFEVLSSKVTFSCVKATIIRTVPYDEEPVNSQALAHECVVCDDGIMTAVWLTVGSRLLYLGCVCISEMSSLKRHVHLAC